MECHILYEPRVDSHAQFMLLYIQTDAILEMLPNLEYLGVQVNCENLSIQGKVVCVLERMKGL